MQKYRKEKSFQKHSVNNKRQPRHGDGTGNRPKLTFRYFCTPTARLSCILYFQLCKKKI